MFQLIEFPVKTPCVVKVVGFGCFEQCFHHPRFDIVVRLDDAYVFAGGLLNPDVHCRPISGICLVNYDNPRVTFTIFLKYFQCSVI